MKQVFEKVETEAKAKGEVRFPTSMTGVQTFDDLKLILGKTIEVLREIETRVATLENKTIL